MPALDPVRRGRQLQGHAPLPQKRELGNWHRTRRRRARASRSGPGLFATGGGSFPAGLGSYRDRLALLARSPRFRTETRVTPRRMSEHGRGQRRRGEDSGAGLEAPARTEPTEQPGLALLSVAVAPAMRNHCHSLHFSTKAIKPLGSRKEPAFLDITTIGRLWEDSVGGTDFLHQILRDEDRRGREGEENRSADRSRSGLCM